MASDQPHPRRSKLQYARLAVQAFFIVFVITGYMILFHPLPAVKRSLLVVTILAGPLFCSWACPLGTLQEWLRTFGRNVLKTTWRVPPRIDRYLTLSRYAVAALFLIGVIPAFFAQARSTTVMLLMGKFAGAAALVVLGVSFLFALFVDRPYCKYACWLGAVDGMFGLARIFSVRRNADACLNCGKCDKACQMAVEVSALRAVRDPHCINCGKCVDACPEPTALSAGFAAPTRADYAAMAKKYSSNKME